MLENSYIYITIIGMALGTYIFRELPYLILGNKKLPENVVIWLSFIPVSIMAALLLPELIVNKSSGTPVLDISANNLFLWVGAATFIFSWFVKNFFGTIIFGMALLATARYFIS